MTRTESLKSLETLLETFLQKAVKQKEDRLHVLEGVNRLDDIARREELANGTSSEVGDWLAEHTGWLNSNVIQPHEADRIRAILGNIAEDLKIAGDETKETQKIQAEINRWDERLVVEPEKPTLAPGQKIVLRRGPESIEEKAKESDTIGVFSELFNSLFDRWESAASGRKHILSALDDLLKSAYLQQNEQALLLSAFIIYYLRQKGYKVEPYVKRLKAAESLIKQKEKSA